MSSTLQKHMRGTVQATIETALVPKELGFNETTRHAVYKHLSGIVIDTFPSSYALGSIVTDSGASLIGLDSALFAFFSDADMQSFSASVDAEIVSIRADIVTNAADIAAIQTDYIKADGTIPFTGDQSMGGNEITSITALKSNGPIKIHNSSGTIEFDNIIGQGTMLDFILFETGNSSFTLRTSDGEYFSTNTDSVADAAIHLGGSTGLRPQVKVRGPFGLDDVAIKVSAVSQVQGDNKLNGTVTVVTPVANANDSVTIPRISTWFSGDSGAQMWVFNDGANTLQIYPFSGDSINNLATNVSVTLAAGAKTLFINISGTRWIQWI